MTPSAPVAFFQFFDVIAIFACFVMFWLLVNTHHKKSGVLPKTLSHTASRSQRSKLAFSIGLTIIYPLYYAFMWLWVGPLACMPEYLYWTLAVCAVCEMIFVWVPAEPGTKSGMVHIAFASVVFAAMFVMAWLILIDGKGLSDAAICALVSFLVSTIAICSLLIFKKIRQHSLLLECIYCIMFFVAISTVAHF